MSHALIVEDDEDSARMIGAAIAREGHSVMVAPTLAAAHRLLAMQPADLLLLDLHLPDGLGFELLENAEALRDTMLVLMTGQATLETSIKALRLGAADYLVKPIHPEHLKGVLARMIAPSRLRAELDQVREAWQDSGNFRQLTGRSEPMQRVYQQISRVAGTSVTAFIHGESGTGKELVARAIHDLSRRREQPFLAVNCGALSTHLIESEIFGHERGSFTGADRQHKGFFEKAHGGTLFLDEVTEMPLALQVKLLRVLETGTFMRVGSTELQQTDVRIIAATNREAAREVEQGRMRDDLLYRLNVFPIALPPLRDRGTDIELLARRFLQEMTPAESAPKYFSADAMARLRSYRWPGNVRELRNAIQRAWVMATGELIDAEWLPTTGAAVAAVAAGAWDGRSSGLPTSDNEIGNDTSADDLRVTLGTSLAEIERQVILATYERCGQHKERTAALLGISTKTLYTRLRDYQR